MKKASHIDMCRKDVAELSSNATKLYSIYFCATNGHTHISVIAAFGFQNHKDWSNNKRVLKQKIDIISFRFAFSVLSE